MVRVVCWLPEDAAARASAVFADEVRIRRAETVWSTASVPVDRNVEDSAMTYGLVLRAGTVVDGSGAPARTADAAVVDGVIVGVGAVIGRGRLGR